MNRLEEYDALLQELEMPVPELEQTLERAKKKRFRRKNVARTFAGLAASFLLFVLLVNFSTPIAYACSQVPILRELAEAVTFSPSLMDAVENEYVQPMNLTQTDGNVSAKIEYLIVDQKQVNIFYRLFSDVYTQMNTEPKVLNENGGFLGSCSYGPNDWDVPNGELRSITIDFVGTDVPESMLLELNITAQETNFENEAPTASINEEEELFHPTGTKVEDYVAEFEFLLEFDPEFTATGKEYVVNQTVELEGQEITITDVEIYPSHMRVNVTDDEGNTAWLKRLDFYIETDYGMKFEPISEGITATGSGDSKSMASFRADSSYFYEAKTIKLVITGAEWLRKDMEKVYINLETGETGELPEGVEFHSAEKLNGGWVLKLRAVQRKENHFHQILTHQFYDSEGNEYEINSWGSYNEFEPNNSESVKYMIEEAPLADFHGTEVWVVPNYSHEWTAKTPIVVTVQ